MESTTDASSSPRAVHLADWALARGRSVFTSDQVADVLGIPVPQVRARLHAPARRGEWTHPLHGLWIAVPPQYRLWGAPPGIEIVDAMMRHLGVDYYVGWLSAAAIHGASHQAAQVFQVATSRDVRDQQVGRTRFQFHTRSDVGRVPLAAPVAWAHGALVSSIEVTMLDVATDVRVAGGIHNVATVVVELAENTSFSVQRLVEAARMYPAAAARRVGWILDTFGDLAEVDLDLDLEPLARAVARSPRGPSRLHPAKDLEGPLEPRWNLHLNTDVEPDL